MNGTFKVVRLLQVTHAMLAITDGTVYNVIHPNMLSIDLAA
jgi:hypothetical protein